MNLQEKIEEYITSRSQNEYLDGLPISAKDYNYSAMLKSIREIFCNLAHDISIDIKDLNNTGLVIFYEYDDDTKSLKMKVYPLNRKSMTNIQVENFEDVIKKINSIRTYENRQHHTKFIETQGKTLEFYKLTIPENRVLDYTDNTLLNKIVNNLDSFNEDEINALDQFYFNNKTSKFILIPLPILTSPSFFIVLENTIKTNNKLMHVINEIYYSTRETVHYYVHNRIITDIALKLTNPDNIFMDEEALVVDYIENLNRVLLPKKFRITNLNTNQVIDEKDYITVWPKNNNCTRIEFLCKNICDNQDCTLPESSFVLDLCCNFRNNKIISFKAEFCLTSFQLPYVDRTELSWIHHIPGYEQHKQQTKQMLEDIFMLIHAQWKQLKEVRKQAVKASRAGILARNFSHNIGSHVMHRATIEQILKRLGISEDTSLDNNTRKFIMAIKNKLDTYIQERNEFLSDISSESIAIGTNVMFYQDIILPFVENVLVMDNIAASENINYHDCLENNSLKIIVRYNAEELKGKYENNEYPSNYPYKPNCDQEKYQEFYNDKKVERDFEVSIPGSLGRHSFYSILENFIRNASKHNHSQISTNDEVKGEFNENGLKIHIDIDDSDNIYYKIKIYDNLTPKKSQDDRNAILKSLQQHLKADLIDSNNEPIKNGLGIADMKINAAYLIQSDEYQKALEIYKYYGNNIVFQFKMLKPKEILIIDNDNNASLNKVVSENQNTVVKQRLDEYLKKPLAVSTTFTLINYNEIKEKLEDELDEILIKFCYRIIVFTSSEETIENTIVKSLIESKLLLSCKIQDLQCENLELLLLSCWKIWFKRWLKDDSMHLFMYFLQNKIEKPTCKWIEYVSNEIVNVNTLYKNGSGIIDSNQLPKRIDGIMVIYDRHGDAHQALVNDIHEKKRLDLLNRDKCILLDKNSSDFSKIFYAKAPPNDKIIMELAESGLLNVLVIDERATEYSFNAMDTKQFKFSMTQGFQTDSEYIKHFDASWASGVFIATSYQIGDSNEKIFLKDLPQGGANEVHNQLNVKISNCDCKINVSFETNLPVSKDSNNVNHLNKFEKKMDALIIHRTKLEEIIKALDTDSKEFIKKLKLEIPFIIVDSGGGNHSQVPGNYKFMSYSNLNSLLLNNRISKFTLSQMILNLTKIGG